MKKDVLSPYLGYFEYATRESWFGGAYGKESDTCVESSRKMETVVCETGFAGAFTIQGPPVASKVISAAYKNRVVGFRYDFRPGRLGSPVVSRFTYRNENFYLYSWGAFPCSSPLRWNLVPTERLASFCTSEKLIALIRVDGPVSLFPLTTETAEFSLLILS